MITQCEIIKTESQDSFTQICSEERMKRLHRLLDLIVYGNHLYGSQPSRALLEVSNAKILHCLTDDFHRLSFDANGQHVVIRYYKVFSVERNGVEEFVGCPTDRMSDLATDVRNILS